MTNADLLRIAEAQLDNATHEQNEYALLCAMRSLAASQLVIARADVHRATP